MQKLYQLWEEHLISPFPKELRGKEVSGIDLILLDAEIAGHISSLVKSSAKKLPDGKIQMLKHNLKELNMVVSELEGTDKKYFQRLQQMVELAID